MAWQDVRLMDKIDVDAAGRLQSSMESCRLSMLAGSAIRLISMIRPWSTTKSNTTRGLTVHVASLFATRCEYLLRRLPAPAALPAPGLRRSLQPTQHHEFPEPGSALPVVVAHTGGTRGSASFFPSKSVTIACDCRSTTSRGRAADSIHFSGARRA